MSRRTTGRRAAFVIAAVALAVPAIAARAQDAAGAAPSRFQYSVEGYAAQYALDRDNNTSATSVGGFGGRISFNRPESAGGRSLFDRATSSLFVTYTGDQGTPKGNTLHVGGAIDASIFRAPLAHVFDPFISLGVGIFRTSRDLPNSTGGRDRLRRSDLALTPGVGARIPFFAGIGARADVRLPCVFGFRTTANAVGEGGLYVSF